MRDVPKGPDKRAAVLVATILVLDIVAAVSSVAGVEPAAPMGLEWSDPTHHDTDMLYDRFGETMSEGFSEEPES
jgi:hypothetical protein